MIIYSNSLVILIIPSVYTSLNIPIMYKRRRITDFEDQDIQLSWKQIEHD